jgi:hypothetical protein
MDDIKFVNRPVIIWTLPKVVSVQVKAHLLPNGSGSIAIVHVLSNLTCEYPRIAFFKIKTKIASQNVVIKKFPMDGKN